jgi:uncharacterized repeat protein (TIGR01451 family)
MKVFTKLVIGIFFAFSFILLAGQNGFAQLTIEPTTWNVIGLDSNKVSDGPNKFPVGAEVCNTTGATITNVTATFNWETSNIYISLEGGVSSVNLGSLAGGECTGAYFIAQVIRNSSAYDTSRGYYISVTGDGIGTFNTPRPRELYIEKLVSQGRNSVLSISGPTTVYVGGTYTYTLNAQTATNGYEQLETFLPFPSSRFQTQSISATYTAPSGATNDKFYADACGWENNPLSTNYRSCIGPNNYPGGKAGGTVNLTYTVKIIGTGNSTLAPLIYDFSGSSYHYNSDIGVNTISINALEGPKLNISKTHSGNFIKGKTGTYDIAVSNTGGVATSGTVNVTDTLPTGLTPTTASGTGWTCSVSGQNVSCNRSDSLAVSSSYPSISIGVNILSTAPSNVINTAAAYGGGDLNHDTPAKAVTSSDPTTLTEPPAISLVKSCPVPANCVSAPQLPDTELTYQIDFSNTGGLSAAGLIIVDGTPANTDFKLGSATANVGTTGMTFVIEYSSDYDPLNPTLATWGHIPADSGGGADPGYDRNVKAIRWRVTAGALPFTAPNNAGSVSFIVKIR